METTTFTTSRVTLLDRNVETIRMWRYMREFRKAKAQRTAVMNEIRAERNPLK